DADGFQDLVCAVTGVPRRRPEPPVGDEDQCPYRGLEAFDEDHAEFFFGREDDTARMLERLRDGRFLAVLGPSGSGKSSLLRAGLVHALERGALRNSDAWPIRTMAPGARPLSALAAALADLGAAKAMGKTLDALAADER